MLRNSKVGEISSVVSIYTAFARSGVALLTTPNRKLEYLHSDIWLSYQVLCDTTFYTLISRLYCESWRRYWMILSDLFAERLWMQGIAILYSLRQS